MRTPIGAMCGMSRYGAAAASGRSVAPAVATANVATIVSCNFESMTILLAE
jgi:hypothetical protein